VAPTALQVGAISFEKRDAMLRLQGASRRRAISCVLGGDGGDM